MKHSVKIALSSLCMLLLSSGCSQVGPNYVEPEVLKTPKSWDENSTELEVSEWWKQFNDATLNTLVEKSYEQNLDLRSAGLRILQARAALGISEGLLYPQGQSLSSSLAATRSGGNNFVSAGVNFDIGWELDVWGKYARGIESSEATLYASVASYDDILVSIIAEVARNYINYRTAQQRAAYAKRNIKIQERVTRMTEVQFNAGNVTELDMQQSRTQLYSTQALLPSFKLAQIQSKNAIAVLLGVLPEELEPLLKSADTNQSLIPIIVLDENFRVSADVVRRRPDLQVAELQAHAQSAKIGMSEAELYPHFSLFGTLGYNSNSASGSWVSLGDAVGISAGPAFSWNIFQYDRIKNQVRVQDALFQESLTNYNKKVLLAVQEVSNGLNGYHLVKEQLRFSAQAVDTTTRAYSLSMTQYENGLVTYQRLLTSVENLTRNEDSYAQIKGNIALQVIGLYKALGGAWSSEVSHEYLNPLDKEALEVRGVDWGDALETNALKGDDE